MMMRDDFLVGRGSLPESPPGIIPSTYLQQMGDIGVSGGAIILKIRASAWVMAYGTLAND
jgi:hypothetical protein